MKVIFIKDLKKQGKKGEIKEVKDGYGMFLVKEGYAVMATKGEINKLKREETMNELQENLLIKDSINLKEKLEKTIVNIPVKTGTNDKVFGSISSKQIKEELGKLGFEIDKKNIKIDESINGLGVHKVSITLHKKVIASVRINLIKKK